MNKKLIVTTTVLISNIAFSQPAAATDVRHSSAEKSTIHNSLTKPNSITKSQAKAAKMTVVVENFARIDTDNDGAVTRQELRLYALSTRRHVPMT